MSLRVAVCVHDAVAAIVQPARVDDVSTLWLKRPHAAGDVVEEVAARPRRSICWPVAKGRIHCPATCCVGVAAAHLGRTHGTHFVDGWRTRGSVAALVTQTLLVSIRVPMHFAIRVAPTTCVVRVAVASSAVFALRVAVAARVVSAASIAAGLDSKLVALAARIAVTLCVFLSIALATTRNPSLKHNSHNSGQQEIESYQRARTHHSLQFRLALDFRHKWYCKPRLSHAVVSTSRAPTVQKEAHRKRIGRPIGEAGG